MSTNNRAALEAILYEYTFASRNPEGYGKGMNIAINQLTALLRQAERDILIANEKELTRRLKLLQNQFKSERDNNSLVFTYVFDQVRQTTNKERIATLRAQVEGQQS